MSTLWTISSSSRVARGLEQAQARRRPDARAAPERRAGDAVLAHGVAGDRPHLVRRRRGRHDGSPTGRRSSGRCARSSRGSRGRPAARHDAIWTMASTSVHHRVLAHQLAEEVVVTSGEPEPPVAGVEHQAVVAAALGVVLLDPRQEDLVVGALVGEVVGAAADDERAVAVSSRRSARVRLLSTIASSSSPSSGCSSRSIQSGCSSVTAPLHVRQAALALRPRSTPTGRTRGTRRCSRRARRRCRGRAGSCPCWPRRPGPAWMFARPTESLDSSSE